MVHVEEILDRIKLPRVFWDTTIAKIPSVCAHKPIIQRFVDNIQANLSDGNGLLLHGPHSSGKSACAGIILKAAARIRKFGLWVRSPELLDLKMNSVEFDDDITWWDRALAVPILVIDELILFKNMNDTLFEQLIRARLSDRRSTIVTTNISLKKIQSDNPAIFEAMREATYPVLVSGHDFRQGKGKYE